MENCNHLFPSRMAILIDSNDDSPECKLGSNHKGPHVGIHPYSGRYLVWEYDYLNGCDCGPDDCECFVWNYLEDYAGREMVSGNRESSFPETRLPGN